MGAFSLSVALLLVLGTGIHAGKVRTKRQADITCLADETEIITTFQYTTATCPELIGGISDYYNEAFREECAYWLQLDDVPFDVPHTYVSECYTYSNDTTKYRAKICCDGHPVVANDELVCFTCNQDQVLHEPQLAYYHTQHCNHYSGDTQICAAGDVCAVELFYSGANRNGLVSKSCMSATDCADLAADNTYNCTLKTEPYCAYCYDSMFGNYDHPNPRPSTTCNPTRCHNGGTCVITGPDGDDFYCICNEQYYTGDRCEIARPCVRNPCQFGGTCVVTGNWTYTCECRTGFNGTHCEIDECDFHPCENGGICSTKYTSPYYYCRCHVPWVGYDCEIAAQECNPNWCLNGGTCYIQDGPDERCLCPAGYEGKRCEYSRPASCEEGSTSELRSYNRYWPISSDPYDCTYYNDVYLQRYIGSYVSNCYSLLQSRYGNPMYKPGIHGVGGPNQAIYAKSCEQGRDYTWAYVQICCAPCGSNPCQNGGWCMNAPRGKFICQCRFNYAGDFCERKLSSCYAAGDPHYYTLDGERMHFQGPCKYTMTEYTAGNGLPDFRVTVKNERRPGTSASVTWPKYVEIEIYGFTIRIAKDNRVYRDGDFQTLLQPYIDPAGRFTIAYNGLNIQFKTSFGLVVAFANNFLVSIQVPSDVSNQVTGMCGNFNDDAADEYVLPDGTDVTNDPARDNIVGNYYKIADPEEPEDPEDPEQCLPPPDPYCHPAIQEAIRSGNDTCGFIEDASGPFAQCIASAPEFLVEIYMENCLYDVCANFCDEEERKATACGSLFAFAMACRSESSPADSNWREVTGCIPECPGELVYKASTSACVPTCGMPNYPEQCPEPNTENCVCDDDMQVYHEGQCVDASECGCFAEGRAIGEEWCSEDRTVRYNCTTCEEPECPRPVGKVMTVGDCDEPCCPLFTGRQCDVAARYNCQNNSPCTPENIYDVSCPTYSTYSPNTYFSHDDNSKYIQCQPGTSLCHEQSCWGGLVWDPVVRGCNWPSWP